VVAPEFGADGAAAGAVVTWDNGAESVSSGIVEGTFGNLAVTADGSYTYSMTRSGRDSMEESVAAEDAFTYYTTDGDGDTVTSTLTLSLQGVANLTDGGPTPLLAAEGDDIFAFALSDEGDAPTDVTISGFGDSGNDVLDLRDLLLGEKAEGADLINYLSISSDGTDTVIDISVSGGFNAGGAPIDQTITLEGIDLVGTSDLATVIQGMLDSGKLSVDQ
ncbi:MAG TPA: type I secretion C-terminal target domain-containing protein, partial [Kineobactrum sp.]